MTSVANCAINGAGLERVRYFARQLITADDMVAEQQYFRQKLRRHNRYLHGWGVVCGLKVLAAPDQPEKGKRKWPWRVKIEGGYALDPYGNELYPEEVCYDLATCLESIGDPCEPGQPPKPVRPKTGKVYVAIRYVECETRPVRVHPLGCGCEDTLCEYSRIRDDFEISCLREMPPSDPIPLLCDLLLPPCPTCPESPWVVLAEVELPKSLDLPVSDHDINNFVRRQLFTTEMLQAQLIACCCDREPEPEPEPSPKKPARVTVVDPLEGESFVNSGPQKIVVTFDKSLIKDTVNPGTLLVVEKLPNGIPIKGTVAYQFVSKSKSLATFTPNDPLGVGTYEIIVRGSGSPHIVDTDNMALDGDKKGGPGGDFTSWFEVKKLW